MLIYSFCSKCRITQRGYYNIYEQLLQHIFTIFLNILFISCRLLMREVNFLFLLVSLHKIFFFDILVRIYTMILAISSRMRTFPTLSCSFILISSDCVSFLLWIPTAMADVSVYKQASYKNVRGLLFWSYWPDLNRRPADYESAALPAEPQ